MNFSEYQNGYQLIFFWSIDQLIVAALFSTSSLPTHMQWPCHSQWGSEAGRLVLLSWLIHSVCRLTGGSLCLESQLFHLFEAGAWRRDQTCHCCWYGDTTTLSTNIPSASVPPPRYIHTPPAWRHTEELKPASSLHLLMSVSSPQWLLSWTTSANQVECGSDQLMYSLASTLFGWKQTNVQSQVLVACSKQPKGGCNYEDYSQKHGLQLLWSGWIHKLTVAPKFKPMADGAPFIFPPPPQGSEKGGRRASSSIKYNPTSNSLSTCISGPLYR